MGRKHESELIDETICVPKYNLVRCIVIDRGNRHTQLDPAFLKTSHNEVRHMTAKFAQRHPRTDCGVELLIAPVCGPQFLDHLHVPMVGRGNLVRRREESVNDPLETAWRAE